MNTPARMCLRLGTLLLSLMVTLLWVGPRAQSSFTRTIDASDPTVQLALGVLQVEAPTVAERSSGGDVKRSPMLELAPMFEAPAAPAVSDLHLPDEIVPVVAPAKSAFEKPICEDV